MRTILFLLFLSNIAYAQSNPSTSEERMDTTIHKDEYYELVYRLNESREKIEVLEHQLSVLINEMSENQLLLNSYKEKLISLDKKSRRKKCK
jgi:hypothetical protein